MILNKQGMAIGVALLAAGLPSCKLRGELVRCLTEPVYDVRISSVVPGRIARIHYHEGSFVEQGSVVLELESRTEQLDVERREVLVGNLGATLERSEMLLKNTSSISREEVDTARSEFKIAQIELELAREALQNRKITAPFSGVVTDLPLSEGEYCDPTQIILRLVDTREFYCVANIEPSKAHGLNMDDQVIFRDNAESGPTALAGRIIYISPIVDPASGLLRIKALFENRSGQVRPGEGGYLELGGES